MFLPIFIPINNDCSCSNKHGYDCQCSSCLSNKEFEKNYSRHYFEYRYAIPKSLFFKNILLTIVKYILTSIGLCVMVYTLFNMYIKYYLTLVFIIFGVAIVLLSLTYFDNLIKPYYKSDKAIKVRRDNNLFSTKTTWEEEMIKLKVPKNYILTKPKNDWEYKKR